MLLIGAFLGLLATTAEARPQIQSFSCNPGVIDARSKDVEVTCATRVIDREADLESVFTRIVSPSGKFSVPLFFNGARAFGLASVSGANLATTFTVPRHAEPGFWQIDYDGVGLQAANKIGQTQLLQGAQASAMGMQRFVKVYSPDDTQAPTLRDVTCNTPVALNTTRAEATDIACRFTVVDQGSGAAFVRAAFSSDDASIPEAERNVLYMTADEVISSKDGVTVLQGVVQGFPGMQGGVYRMVTEGASAPYLEDRNFNGFTYGGLDTAKLFSTPFFEVFSQPDTTPPVLQKFSCNQNQLVVPYDGVDTFACQLVVQDDLSGFKYGELSLDSPDRNGSMVLRLDPNSRQVAFSRGGVFTPQLSFDRDAAGGMWTASKEGLVLYDWAGNAARFTPADLNQRALPSFVLVYKQAPPAPSDSDEETGPKPKKSNLALIASLATILPAVALGAAYVVYKRRTGQAQPAAQA